MYYAPYLQHNTPKVKDGFGDVGFLYKYRFLSKNEMDGNYMLSAQLSATIPTGSYSNGSLDSSISPTVLAGKGFGKLDVISCLGELCPRRKPTKWADPSRGIRPRSIISPSTCGPSWSQTPPGFLLGRIMARCKISYPGILFSKFKLRPSDETSRAGVAFGAAMQIATSQFHTYNHELAFTSRLVF